MQIRFPGDPIKPTINSDPEDIERFLAAGQAWYSSHFFSGQIANDNKDWPLEKLLNTERNGHCLKLAHRYRALYDTATRPTDLVGSDASENVYLVRNEDKDGKPKEVKVVTGRKANFETEPTRKSSAGTTKQLAAPVAKKWVGDIPLISKIDAVAELAVVRHKLAVSDNVISAFEAAVVDGDTLEKIGLDLGFGTKGCKGAARALIFTGIEIVDRHWQRQAA